MIQQDSVATSAAYEHSWHTDPDPKDKLTEMNYLPNQEENDDCQELESIAVPTDKICLQTCKIRHMYNYYWFTLFLD